MLALFASVVALADAPPTRRLRGVFDPFPDGRRPRAAKAGVPPRALPYLFEFAPADGTGMGVVCACTAPKDASLANSLSTSRTATGTCLKGSVTSGIAVGDLVTCATNTPRVMPGGDGTGPLGLLVEDNATNLALRSEEFDNAAWTSTATVTANTALSPANTMTADTLDDESGPAQLGSCQTITTSAKKRPSLSVFLKGGTSTKAQISITGTGDSTGDRTCSFSSLSTTTYTRATCTSATAYAGTFSAVTICVLVGTAASDVGTIIAWGAQYEDGRTTTGGGWDSSFPSSYIATTSASVARDGDLTTFASVPSVAAIGSSATTFIPAFNAADGYGSGILAANTGSGRYLEGRSNANVSMYDGTTQPSAGATFITNTPGRYVSTWSNLDGGMTIQNLTGATKTTVAFDGLMSVAGTLGVGYTAADGAGYGVFKLVCLDSSPVSCLSYQ